MSEYDTDLEPLLSIITVRFQFEVISFLNKQHSKYSEQVLTNTAARQEIHEFIKETVNVIVNKLLSKQYISKLTTKYFSPEGLDLVIYYFIYDKSLDYLKEKTNK